MANIHVETELNVQSNYWFTYRAANVAVFAFIIIAAMNDHSMFAMVAALVQIVFNATRVPQLIAEFDERIKHVTFKTQIENLYVFSEFEGQSDATVAATFQTVVAYLKTVGNEHEVRVHMVIFRDVSIFTWFWDAKRNLQKQTKPRPPLSSAETWEQYFQATQQFKIEDHDNRLRDLRKDQSGFDWVNQHVFNQDFNQWQQNEN